jgi:hypothetical protein
MNRRSFFKFLGIGAATAAVAPKMLADKPKYTIGIDTAIGNDRTVVDWDRKNLTVFEEPRGKADYSIGVVVGNGLRNSTYPSVVSVMRKGNGDEPDVQVAEYVSYEIPPSYLAYVIADMARRYVEVCTDPRGPMLVIEQVESFGDLVQHQLKQMGFKRFFTTKTAMWKEKEGWYCTRLSKPIITSRFEYAVESGWYKPKSSRLGKISNKPAFMAAAQSYIGLNAKDKL